MITEYMWRADTKQLRAVRVACPNGLYPAKDADGEKIFVNTHYSTESEAWNHLRVHTEISVRWAAEAIEKAQRDLSAAQVRAGEAAIEFAKVMEGLKAKPGKNNERPDVGD